MPRTSALMTGKAATKTPRIWNGNLSAMSTATARIAVRRNTIDMKWKKLEITANDASAIMSETATETTTTTTTGTVTGITGMTGTDKAGVNLSAADNP